VIVEYNNLITQLPNNLRQEITPDTTQHSFC